MSFLRKTFDRKHVVNHVFLLNAIGLQSTPIHIVICLLFQLQYKRLDKNLKNDNSENDLLSYLQSKQMRTRRVSQAVWNQPISESPELGEQHIGRGEQMGRRRRSLAPAALTSNYRRRLSLAVPMENTHMGGRKRGESAGNVLRGLDSPERRRLRYKMSRSLDTHSEDSQEHSNLTSLATDVIHEEDERANGVSFALDSPSSPVSGPTKAPKQANPNNEQVIQQSPKAKLFLRGEIRHGKLKRSNTIDEQDLQSKAIEMIEASGSRRGLKRYGSDKEQRRHSPRIVRFADKPDTTVKCVPPKLSPTVVRPKPMLKHHAKSLDEVHDETKSEPQNLLDPTLIHKGSLRKNPSYNRAIIDHFLESDDETV